MSDEDDVCENSGERIHPHQVMTFKKNDQIEDDDDDDDDGKPESFKETMRIPKQELDHTVYDNYTYKYGTLRKGKVDKTNRSMRVCAVYRNCRFITCIIRNFYRSARHIPYPVLFRGDGIGGIEGAIFLYTQKRLTPVLDEEAPPIDLNELQNWGRKGVIFGNRENLFQEVVPFELRQGGRIKKYSEDKIVEIEGEEKVDFCDIKVRIFDCYRMFHKECVILKYPYEKFKEPEPIPPLPFSTVLIEGGTSTDDDSESLLTAYSGGEIGRINTILYEDQREHVLAQVNFEMVKLAEENVVRVQQGKTPIPLDNITKLNLFFQMTQAEEMDPTRPALTPRTLRRGTFNFPEGFDENRDMGEEGKESFDRGEDSTIEDTPPVDDVTEGEREVVSAQVLFTRIQGLVTEDNRIEDDTPVTDNPTDHTEPESDVNKGMEAVDTPLTDNPTDHTEPESDVNQGMEAIDTPLTDNPTDHTEPESDVNQGMEAADTPVTDNPTDHTEPESDVNQGMEAVDTPLTDNTANQEMDTDTDENAGNDTDITIDYIRGVEIEIETEYESGRHICLRRGFDIGF